MNTWRLAHGTALDLSRPAVMGILNITPDSFADGGKYTSANAALAAAEAMVHEGATILDIGGESTRPGSHRIDAQEQIARVLPVVHAIRAARGPVSTIALSIDTTLAPVALAALDAGANAINDVSGGTEDPHLLSAVAAANAGLILMHRLVAPTLDQYSDQYASPPTYTDVVETVINAFAHTLLPAAAAAGITPSQLIVDPGLGFGKSVNDNLNLINGCARMTAALHHPVLSALSRKSFVGRVSLHRDSTPSERLAGTLALSLQHWQAGARLFRVHDVGPHIQALNAASAAHSLAANAPAAPQRPA